MDTKALLKVGGGLATVAAIVLGVRKALAARASAPVVAQTPGPTMPDTATMAPDKAAALRKIAQRNTVAADKAAALRKIQDMRVKKAGLRGLGGTVPTPPRRYLSRPYVAAVHRWEGVFGGEPGGMLPYGAAPNGPYVGASTGMSTRVPKRSMMPSVPFGGAQRPVPKRPGALTVPLRPKALAVPGGQAALKVAPIATNGRAIAPAGAPVVQLSVPRRVA